MSIMLIALIYVVMSKILHCCWAGVMANRFFGLEKALGDLNAI